MLLYVAKKMFPSFIPLFICFDESLTLCLFGFVKPLNRFINWKSHTKMANVTTDLFFNFGAHKSILSHVKQTASSHRHTHTIDMHESTNKNG